MVLKNKVEEVLKKKKRSMSWLAEEMGKSVDGLRLSLVRESIKYVDINKMAEILEVPAALFFPNSSELYQEISSVSKVSESGSEFEELKYYKGMVALLKDQLNDKQKIITLLSNSK